ncbi:MAG: RHS repeat protein, partial [Bacteroidales bacterium]|nr:RHS repeat protein [Bacteroidales bacterium]
TTFLDRGDISRNDDEITVTIDYQTNAGNNLVSLPVEQKVLDHANNLLRHRQMQYNNEGSPVQLDIVGETENSTISMTYDGYGNLATVLMPENAAGQRYARSYTYDPVLYTHCVNLINSFGESCTFEYDYSRGLCTKQTDPNGNYIVTEYDWLSRPVKVTAPDEIASGAPYSLKIKYYPARWYGQVRADHSSAATLRYDPQHPADSLESVAICDGWGRPLQTQTDFGAGTSVVAGNCLYDEFGRVTAQYYPFVGNAPPSNTYNGGHNVSTATTTVYDVLDRKKTVTRPDGHGQSMVYGFQNYGGMRFVTAATDANGNTTVSYADVRGNTLKVEAPENATTLFEYDALGRTTQTTDPDGFTTTYSYDLRGRLTSTAHPDKGTTTMAYDKAGNLTHKATQKLTDQGVDIEYVYDYNRLTEVHYPLLPQNNVTYTYGTTSNTGTNACGRLLRVDDGSGYQIFSYDKLGNVAENTRAIALPFEDSVYNFRMMFEYDSWNRVQRIVYPDSEVVTYNYDLGGQLCRVHNYKANHRDTLIKNILYDEFGHRTQVVFGNGVTTNYTYDILQRLSLLETKKPSSPALQKISYSFDLEDNITKVVNTAAGANGLGGAYVNTYNYDDLYRLTAANGSYSGNNTNYSLEMAYTPAGRLCSKLQDFTGTGNVYAYSQNSKQHAVRRIFNGLTNELSNLRWDGNGNLAQQTLYSVNNNVPTYQTMRMLFWDEDDRLNLVAGDGYLSYYAYGYDGNRAIKMTGNATIDQNGTLINTSDLSNITIYPNEYLTVTQAEYTKYYYAGGNRIASKIGTGGLGKMTVLCTLDQNLSYSANTLINNVLQQVVNTTNQPNDEYPVNTCGGYNVATELLTSQLPDFYISNTAFNFTQSNLLQQFRQNLAGGTEPVYYFHSDHLGSAS